MDKELSMRWHCCVLFKEQTHLPLRIAFIGVWCNTQPLLQMFDLQTTKVLSERKTVSSNSSLDVYMGALSWNIELWQHRCYRKMAYRSGGKFATS